MQYFDVKISKCFLSDDSNALWFTEKFLLSISIGFINVEKSLIIYVKLCVNLK